MADTTLVYTPRRVGRTSAQHAALLEALATYPQRNTHQLQAAKVCAGVVELAKQLLPDHLAQGASKATRNGSGLVQRVLEQEAAIEQLRAALAGLIGGSDMAFLNGMEEAIRTMPAPDADKAASINAIHALIYTAPYAKPSASDEVRHG